MCSLIIKKMIKSILILKVCLTISLFSFGQNDYINYHLKSFQARKLAYEQKLDSALVFYKQAFELVDYIHIKNLKAANKIAKKLKDKPFYKITSDKIKSFNNQSNFNNNYRKIIDSIAVEDQIVRSNKYYQAQQVYYKYMKDSLSNKTIDEFVQSQKLMTEWFHVDSMNIEKLLSLITKYGFPSEKNIGKEGYRKAFIVLLHFDTDQDNSILKPIIDKALFNGDIAPDDYAWIIDRRLTWCQGKDPYYYHMPFGLDKLTEVEIKNINERRKKIGLRKLYEGVEITKDDMSIAIKELY
ncbi:MAG: hypothetical protein COW67_09795 [Flavobacteriales bacterium CG18_big_fil_WC_8_21_14_2_50_32_9]|nr:MAG: hypothetical protein COW67_09795 [Flavobacteriales bacterium CG18_big_fil_WC_8_21_14_2_50_32_9]